MSVIRLHDKNRIEAFLRKNVYLHIYGIGDLDDFFWPYTTWYCWEEKGEIQAIVLLYAASDDPTILALSEQQDIMWELVQSIFHILPERFYAHLSPAVAEALERQCKTESHGKHYKMGLMNKASVREIDCSKVIRLTENDLKDMLVLYEEGYPGNWFNPKMLRTRQYFGMRLKNRLVSIAGVHVYSEKYKVAALGNIITHPDYRGRGFAKTVTAALCQSLLENVDDIGLNVKAENNDAVTMYRKLGFEIAATYYELMVLSHPSK
jgi:predicted GNAT family acetyltransferase